MSWLEQAWYNKDKRVWALLPLSALFAGLSATRRYLFKLGIKPSYHPDVPVIVVGNITVGGTGKTPMTVYLIEQLKRLGFKPGIVSRGYGSQLTHYPYLLTKNDTADLVGDEPKLLAERCEVPVVIGADRVKAAKHLLDNSDCNVIVSDDGLQHYALARDLEIIMLDGKRQLGNGFLLPAGPLREGRWRLKQSDLVIETNNPTAELSIAVKPQMPVHINGLTTGIEFDFQREYIAVSGIGNPERFYHSLDEQAINIVEKHSFPDHHDFSAADFMPFAERSVIMTEKDAVKCRLFARDNWWFLPIVAQPNLALTDKLMNKLQKLKQDYGI